MNGKAQRSQAMNLLRRLVICIQLLFSSFMFSPRAEAQTCYQFRWIDNAVSDWKGAWSEAYAEWRARKNNGAEPTGCGPTGRLYDIGEAVVTGTCPECSYTIPARLTPTDNIINLACSAVQSRICPADFYLRVDTDPQCQDGNCMGDPIVPESGAVVVKDDDIPATSGGLTFSRFYNSLIQSTSGLSPGWSHSYSRRILERRATPPYKPYLEGGIKSSLYLDQASACTNGFTEIRSAISNWSTGAASYSGGVCTVAVGGATVGTITVYSQVPVPPNPTAALIGYDVVRDNGRVLRFTPGGSSFTASPGISLKFEQSPTGFEVTDEGNNVETYDTNGKLLSVQSRTGKTLTASYDTAGLLAGVVDDFGHTISLTHNSSGKLTTVTSPAGQAFAFGFDGSQRLSTVTNADTTTQTYKYESAGYPNALTGRIDESAVRHSTWEYRGDGRASNTHEGANLNSYSFNYNSNGNVTVTDPLGAVRTFTFARFGDRFVNTGISGSRCNSCKNDAQTSYDTNGYVSASPDYVGNLTCFEHEPARGLETTRVEGFAPSVANCPASLSTYSPAVGTRERKIVTTWHSAFRVPTSIAEAGRTTSFTHDSNGNVLTRTITDISVTPNSSRTWTYTYNSFGQVLTEDGPRVDVSDVTTYVYYSCATGYECGQLNTVTNALGHVTTFNTYNANGQPTQITDANGLVTGLAYDSRQRLTDRCAGATLPGCVGGELTHLDYWPAGLLKKVTNPDASFIAYTYDAAHRLTQINDGSLNKIVYTLDAIGNRIVELTYDPSLALKHVHSRVFNALNQLWKDVPAASTGNLITTFGYDSNGNQTSVNAPLSRNSTSLYDELNRLKQITDPASGITQFGYDANDNLTTVTDPRALVTSYTYSGFGDLKTQASPDTGLTTNTYDSGGNLETTTDARDAITTYTYDELNRVRTAAFKIGSTTDQTITYAYDAGTNGKGHLTSADDANHALAWTYDAQGRIIGKGQSVTGATPVLSIGYGYNAQGQLFHVVLPSGRAITYGYNSNGQVNSVALDGSPSTTILNNVTYDPFGPITGWTWGNGTATASRTFDMDGNLTALSSTATAVGNRTLGYDYAFRISTTTDSLSSALNWTFGYDSLDRLNSAAKSGTTIGYTYDANGNRLTQTGTTASTYTVAGTSNKLSSSTGGLVRTYTYDASGSVLTSGATTHTYYNSGRMKTGKLGSASTTTYIYNALGQRIKKSGGAITTAVYFMYDEAGHLVGEYNISGSTVTPVQETVWFGDIPIATLRVIAGVTTVFYVHTDHLNTPRKVTNTANQLRWKWDPTPFGEGAPTENPNPPNLGTFEYNLRFPGQYFDLETNLNYNYFRDYDPAVGRYTKSDPIGLLGGINTYSYALNDPMLLYDPYWLWVPPSPPQWLVDGAAGFGDTLSFGLSGVARRAFGWDSSVDKCSRAYRGGELAGVGYSLAFGGAHLGRAALNQGAKKVFSDPRGWSAVQRSWSNAVGGYLGRYELHHWFTPQSLGGTNAAWNYMAVSPWLNNAMSNGGLLYDAFKLSVLGIYGAAPTAAVNTAANDCECQQ